MYAPQYITDNQGNKLSVVLSIKQYEKLIEELEDIRLYDEAKKTGGESIPFEEYLNQRRKKQND